MDPFAILSKEIWAKVLENIDDSVDRLNLIESNSVLGKAFENQKFEWSFAAVLPIVMKNFESTPHWHHSRKKLQHSFIQCRLVSSACVKAIQSYSEEYLTRDMYNDRGLSCILPMLSLHSRTEICCCYNSIKKAPQGSCPLLRKDMELYCERFKDPNYAMIDASILLMENIGHHLHGISIKIIGFQNFPAVVLYLQTLLRLLPNLRNLNYNMNSVGEEINHENLSEKRIKSFQLPALPHLKHLVLRISDDDAIPLPLTQYICFMKYFPQLTNLFISPVLWNEEYNNVEGLFLNLQILKLINVDVLKSSELYKIYRLFSNMDAPRLKYILAATVLVSTKQNSSESEEHELLDKYTSYLERMAIYLLAVGDYGDPNKNWKSNKKALHWTIEENLEGDGGEKGDGKVNVQYCKRWRVVWYFSDPFDHNIIKAD